MKKIEILVSCHTDSYVPENNLLKSIQVGTANKKHLDNMTYFDDSGDNISEKNDKFCELTAQYWAWKNLDSDYYGFFHYRRYLSFNEKKYAVNPYNEVEYGRIDDSLISTLGLDENSIQKFVGNYDIIVPEPMNIKTDYFLSNHKKNIYNHYKHAPGHNIKDYDFCLNYIKENYPEYQKASEKYNNSQLCYFKNTYVLKKEIFFDYCEWLFPILNAFNQQKDYSFCSIQEIRAAGFLAERLFGIYLTYQKAKNPALRIKETQQAYIKNTSNLYPEPKKENSIAVCLGCDDYYVPLAGNVITSIMCNSLPDKFYDIFVMTNNVTDFSKEDLLKLTGVYKNLSIRFVDGSAYLDDLKLFERHHVNKSTYLRFAILDFLKNFDKAVYVDCDLIVNRDIADLHDIDVEGYYFGAVRDTIETRYKNPDLKMTQFEYNKKFIGLENPFEYFNAGVLLLNLKELRKDYSTKTLYDLAGTRNWYWQDQDILNFIGKEGKIKFIEQNWNVIAHCFNSKLADTPEAAMPKSLFETYKQARLNPYIIHYVSRSIPCFTNTSDLFHYFWKYARQSIFYEKILFIMAQNAGGHETYKHFIAFKHKLRKISLLRRLADKLFPKDTKRRAFIKKLISPFRKNTQ